MSENTTKTSTEAAWIPVLKKQLKSLRFGVVQIVVHDGRVVQIERTERIRFSEPASLDSFDPAI